MKYNPQLFELIYSFIILLKILFILTLPVITRRRVTVLGVCQAWFCGFVCPWIPGSVCRSMDPSVPPNGTICFE